jgi:membrane protease YdiL (CAAX protease family)
VDASSIPPPATSLNGPPARGGSQAPVPAWAPWTAPAALVCGLVLAAVGSLLVDIPALALGADVSSSHIPPGLTIADTFVQDAAFVVVSVFFAQLGGRAVSAAMFGLRPTRLPRAVRLAIATVLAFLLFSILWSAIFHPAKEKLLEQLGTDESTLLLLLSAGLTCVIAPICEEFLFRGYIFTSLRNWRGVWPAAIISGVAFGGVHAGSAPAADLVPLAGLGFGLCLLYRATGSLYPGIAAHSLNNSLAFGLLEDWGWQIAVLMAASLTVIALLALALIRTGVISSEPRGGAGCAVSVTPDG